MKNNTKKIEKISSINPHPVDKFVGNKIKSRRKILSMSQADLGDSMGVTFQQVQKYERGANRIGASRLYELSHILKAPVNYFFDGLTQSVYPVNPKSITKISEKKSASYEVSWLNNKELLDLVRAYNKIEDPKLRKQVFELAKSLAKHFEEAKSKETV